MTVPSPIYRDGSLPLGNDEPRRRNTYIENKERTRTIHLGFNVGVRPSGTGGFALSKADGTTIQAEDDIVRRNLRDCIIY